MASESQICRVHFNDDPMTASASRSEQPQSPQPQPQLPRRRPHQASWKGGVVGLYGAGTPAMDPISGVGEKKERAPRMFRQPPKRKSDAVKAAKQASFSSPREKKMTNLPDLDCIAKMCERVDGH